MAEIMWYAVKVTLVHSLMEKMKFKEAIFECQKAIDGFEVGEFHFTSFEFAEFHHLSGLCHIFQQEYENAYVCLDIANGIAPENPSIKLNLISVELQLGRVEEALNLIASLPRDLDEDGKGILEENISAAVGEGKLTWDKIENLKKRGYYDN